MTLNIRADDGSLNSAVLPLSVKVGGRGSFTKQKYWDTGKWGKDQRSALLRAARKNKTRLEDLVQAWDIKWTHFEDLAKVDNLTDVCLIFLEHPWWDELFNFENVEKNAELRNSLGISWEHSPNLQKESV
jgi:hypothetical protein